VYSMLVLGGEKGLYMHKAMQRQTSRGKHGLSTQRGCQVVHASTMGML
jgi:hypothetical protein